MEHAPEEETILGALGLDATFPETFRVIRCRPPGFSFLLGMVITLSLSLLAHVAVSRSLFADAVATSGAGFVGIAANWAPFFLAEAAFICIIVFQSHISAAFCILSIAPRYPGFADDADRDARSVARDLRGLPRFLSKYLVSVFRGDSRLAARLVRTGLSVVPFVTVTSCVGCLLFLGFTAFLAAVAGLMHLPRAALLLVGGGSAYIAGTAHIGAVWRVGRVLEDGAMGSRAMHRSDELLASAGKFWAAAAVLMALDCFAVALPVQLAFGALVVANKMGFGILLRVTLGVAMAAMLWAAVTAGLVAQVVVYFLCKRAIADAATAP
jgi:hypothetical protein